MAPGDIAFKSNFATLDPQSGIVVRRRADRRWGWRIAWLCWLPRPLMHRQLAGCWAQLIRFVGCCVAC